MPGQHGKFCWYELLTSDPAGAEKFYSAVVGWTFEPMGVAGPEPYTILKTGEHGVAGMMKLPEEAKAQGARPSWMGYIWVDDVDATAAKIAEKGGQVWRQPDDIPNIGRFAIVGDPQGAAFALFKDAGMQEPTPPAPGTPGTIGWRELLAQNWETAFAFYSELFGWTKDTAHDMGPMGTYQLFAVDGHPTGGMMTKPADVPVAFWGYYIVVEGGAKAAAERIKANGGQVLNGPVEVPGGSWIVQGFDPQGAMFAVVSPQA
jgi:uncharacterized protein